MVSGALLPAVNPVSTLLSLSTTFNDYGAPRQLRWGERAEHKGSQDSMARFWRNVTLSNVLPVNVPSKDIQSFMAPKALQSDVGSLMPRAQKTRRRTPRHPTPAVFPHNEPNRRNTKGLYVLSQPTREALDACNKSLYVTPWASKTYPDYTPVIRRSVKLEQKSRLLRKRPEIVREPLEDYETFRYTTVYRDSYTKRKLVADQSKVYLPPIQRKTTQANSNEETEDEQEARPCEEEQEERPCEEEQEERSCEEDVPYDQAKDKRDGDVQQIPFCESLVNIRQRLRCERWALPAIYTRCHQSYNKNFENYRENRDLGHSRDPSFEASYLQQEQSQKKLPCDNVIRCNSANLIPNYVPNSDSFPLSNKLAERVKINFSNVGGTRIKATPSLQKASDSKGEVGLRSQRRVHFDPNISPYFSQRQVSQREEEEETDAESETEEDLDGGFGRRTLLPRLQVPDFRSLCHSRHHLIHLEHVPDLRDFTTYSKRVNFDGINSSVFRG